MEGQIYTTLRSANEARAAIWGAGGIINLDWRVNELVGEAGEACNVMKKLVREQKKERGSRATYDDLLEELSDVIICLDLLAMAESLPDLDLKEAYDPLPNADLNAYGVWLGVATGKIAENHFNQNIDPGYRRSLGLSSARAPIQIHQDVLLAATQASIGVVNTIAREIGIVDMRVAVSNKFNRTSIRHSLPVLLNLEDVLTESEVRSGGER